MISHRTKALLLRQAASPFSAYAIVSEIQRGHSTSTALAPPTFATSRSL